MAANEINRYDLILNLKGLNNELLQCTTYNEVDNCRLILLSYIENNSILKNIYQDIISKEDVLKKESEFNTCINRIYSYVIAMLNALTRYRTFTLSRQKIHYLKDLTEVTRVENDKIVGRFVECPNLMYYSSLTLLLPPRNYLELTINNQPITYLCDLYSLFDDNDKVFQKAFLMMTLKYNLEYFILNEDSFNIGQQENNFNAAYLRCVVYTINESLQAFLQNHKNNITTETVTSNDSQNTPQLFNLTSTETRIYNLINEETSIKSLATALQDYSQRNDTTRKHLKNIAIKLGYKTGALNSIKKYKRSLTP